MSDETTLLREKLTKRGIEYTTNDHMGAYETSWNGFTAMQLTPSAKLLMVFTPDQAIAATVGSESNPDGLPAGLTISDDGTLLNWRGENYVKQSALGSGTLTAEQVEKAIRDCSTYASYDGCTYYASGIRLQAIADELNAELGSGTCHITASATDGLCSHKPRKHFELSCGHGFTLDGLEAPAACAVCGRKVER